MFDHKNNAFSLTLIIIIACASIIFVNNNPGIGLSIRSIESVGDCSDSDGVNYLTQGSVTGGRNTCVGGVCVDYCYDTSTVIEYFCGSNNRAKRELGSCGSSNCSDGACQPLVISNVECNAPACSGAQYCANGLWADCSVGSQCVDGTCQKIPECTSPSCNGPSQYCLNGLWQDCGNGEECTNGACSLLNTALPKPVLSEETNTLQIYDDNYLSPWADTSYSGVFDIENTEKVYSGTKSIKAVTAPWGSLSPQTWSSPTNIAFYTAIEFSVYSDETFSLSLGLQSGSTFKRSIQQTKTSAGQWTKIKVPITSFSWDTAVPVDRLYISGDSNSRTWFVDDIKFTGNQINQTPICVDECLVDSKQCSGNGYQTCADYNNDGCSEWSSTTTNCLANQTCTSGNCVDNQFCAPGILESGKQCSVCNADGSAYVKDTNLCDSSANCDSNGMCIPITQCTAPSCSVSGQYCTTSGMWANCSTGTSCSAGICNNIIDTSGKLSVYSGGNSLNNLWKDYSWGATNVLGSTERSYDISSVIKSVLSSWGGLQLNYSSTVDAKKYDKLTFAIYTDIATTIAVSVKDNTGTIPALNVQRQISAGWNTVSYSISELDPNRIGINYFWIQNYFGAVRTFYIDNIEFSSSGIVNCTSVCTTGAKICSGNGYLTCADYNNDSCSEWSSTTTNCLANQTCSGGSCIPIPVLPLCSAPSCSVSGQYCTSIGTWANCSIGTSCSQGSCITNTYSVSVSKSGNGTGTVTSTPSGINCGSACSANYNFGTLVSLIASANPSNIFASWSGACSGSGLCTINVTSAKYAVATFNTNIITQCSVGQCSGTSMYCTPSGMWANCSAGTSCSAGSCAASCTSTCSNNTKQCSGNGYQTCGDYNSDGCFEWGSTTYACSNGQTCSGGNCVFNNYTFTISKSGTGSGSLTSTPSGINCGASCSSNFVYGTIVSVVASPASGSTFASWSGACTGNGICTVNITSAKSAVATFNVAQVCTPGLLESGKQCSVCNSLGSGYTLDGTKCSSGYSCNATTGQCAINTVIPPAQNNNFWVTAYYPTWAYGKLPPSAINYTGLTHIIEWSSDPISTSPFFNCCGSGIGGSASTQLLTYSHQNGVKVLLGLTALGGGSSGTSLTLNNIVANAANAQTLVNNYLDYAYSKGYDGIDVDWEWPPSKTAFSNFVIMLRDGMDARWGVGKGVLAVATYSDNSKYDPVILNAKVDQINIMSYDLGQSDPYVGLNSPLDKADCYYAGGQWSAWTIADHGPAAWAAKGFNVSKLGLGLPFYGWSNANTAACQAKGAGKLVEYYNLLPTLNTYGNIKWDTHSQTPWMTYSDGSGNHFVSFDNETSLMAKVNYAKIKNMGGVMIYTLDYGYISSNPVGKKDPLMRAVAQAVLSGSTQVCTPGLLESGKQCSVCNALGSGYVLDGTKCSSGYSCSSSGTCTLNPVVPPTTQCSVGQCNGTSQYCTSSGTWGTCTQGTSCSAGSCITNTYSVSVSKSGTGSGTVTSSLSGINCGATCSANYNSGTALTLTASATSGSIFAGWSGACSGTGICSLTVTSAKSVVATFNTNVAPQCSNGQCNTTTNSYCNNGQWTTCSSGYVCSAGSCVSSGGTPAKFFVTGYFPTWSVQGASSDMAPSQMNWVGLTHIIHFSATTKSTAPFFDGSGLNAYNQQKDLINYAHANNVNVFLSITGPAGAAFAAIVHDPTNMKLYIDNASAEAKLAGYDGLEFDWETSVNWNDYVAMLNYTRIKLNNWTTRTPRGELALATMNGWWTGSGNNVMQATVPWVDQYNMMTYDMNIVGSGFVYPGAGGPQDINGYNSPLYRPGTDYMGLYNYQGTDSGPGWDFATNKYSQTASGPLGWVAHQTWMPLNKIALGIPFYGWVYNGITTPGDPTGGAAVRHYNNYKETLQAIKSVGGYTWDNNAKVPWVGGTATTTFGGWQWSVSPGGKFYITYDDTDSVALKVAWAKANGVGGIMIYDLNSGWLPTPATNGDPKYPGVKDPLMRAVANALNST